MYIRCSISQTTAHGSFVPFTAVKSQDFQGDGPSVDFVSDRNLHPNEDHQQGIGRTKRTMNEWVAVLALGICSCPYLAVVGSWQGYMMREVIAIRNPRYPDRTLGNLGRSNALSCISALNPVDVGLNKWRMFCEVDAHGRTDPKSHNASGVRENKE